MQKKTLLVNKLKECEENKSILHCTVYQSKINNLSHSFCDALCK